MNSRHLLLVLTLVVFPVIAASQPLQWSEADGGNGHWYQVVMTPQTISWNDANAAATAATLHGQIGYLVTLTSTEENSWVLGHLQMGDVWTGAIQAPGSTEPLGGWSWITGEPWSFTNWCSGEPANTGGDEDRLTITYSWPRCPGGWNDASQYNVTSGYLIEWNDAAVATEVRNWGSLKAIFGSGSN